MSLQFKLIANLVFWMAFFGALLFVPAGTLHWWRGCVFLGVFPVSTIAAVVSLLPAHRDLIEERPACSCPP